MSAKRLESGDRVVHPMFGFGVVEAVITRGRAGQTKDYYDIRLNSIRLADGGVLSVPVAHADELGLRLAANSLAVIVACLRSAAHALPDDSRERVMELSARWRTAQPLALVQTVRDLLGRSHTRGLTGGDRKWLTSARERLSAEAALVDGIELAEARTAIQHEMDQIKLPKPA